MKKIVEKTARTEEEAIDLALVELGKERDEVSVEIVERAKSGFLGLGGTPAKVRITYEYEDLKISSLREFLSGLFERIGAIVEMEIKTDDQGAINAILSGPKIGELIGRRGETLDAIQHLSNYAVNRGSADRVRINIDAENYRAKRSEALESLAKKIAAKALKLRRDVTLEPMNAYERHVIHAALQDFLGVTTSSIGTDPNRRIVVAYDSNTDPKRSGKSRE